MTLPVDQSFGKFSVGDEVWYKGRGSSFNERVGRIDGRIALFRNAGCAPPGPMGAIIGSPLTGSWVPIEDLHHANELVRFAREIE
jgi:hypothetical protein